MKNEQRVFSDMDSDRYIQRNSPKATFFSKEENEADTKGVAVT